ncbi:protein tyrosine phosphatase [Variovorax sp. LG9.2]|uniref:arsenate reductase/protein-tyrosine-phosphatase family protein n=1 Tax=Variovorax sp. LG9.2 TaxID=3048626 RepID=UPI002B22BA81|nr:protein tyrosine phosphatase [Variovorax sp. LG9.2]MEB0060345.1 protein tyrosine phosphatase [Variovorax sp. LG9.2]
MTAVNRVTVVFVSKRNSLRSVLAQACLQHLGDDRFAVVSCGWPGHIADRIHPAALGALAGASMPPPAMIPAAWSHFQARHLARASFIITLDAETHGQEPSWPGQPDSALWEMPDAAALKEPQAAANGAVQILYSLRRRIELFINLPLAKGDRASLRDDIRDMGKMG